MKFISKIAKKIKSIFKKKDETPPPSDLGIHVEETVKSQEIFGRP